MATSQPPSNGNVWWRPSTGKRFVTSNIFSLEITLANDAYKDADFAKRDDEKWHKSIFKPPESDKFKIFCPDNEPRMIEKMDEFLNFGYQVACLTMKMPPGREKFTINIEYDGKTYPIPCHMALNQGPDVQQQRLCRPDTPTSDRCNDSGIDLCSPLGRLTMSPGRLTMSPGDCPSTPPRASVSPPRRLDYDSDAG